jgi:hypothetical protein
VFEIRGVPSLTATSNEDATASSVTPQDLPITALSTLDPQGSPPTENDDLLAELVDGDPETRWRTDTYSAADFGNLKDGLGIVIDLGEVVQPTALTLETPSPGINYDIRVSDELSNDPETWRTVGKVRDSVARPVITFEQEQIETRYLMIWIVAPLVQYDRGWSAAFSEISIEGIRP